MQRLKINQFYGAPTAYRLLLKFEDSWVKKYDRSSLRTVGSGERLQAHVWWSCAGLWMLQHDGRVCAEST